jgi:hypothetical protein
MSVEVNQVDIAVSVYVDLGVVYDDASEVVDNGNWPTRKEVVDKIVVRDEAVAIGMTREKAQMCVGKFRHKQPNGQTRGALINGVKYKFVEPEGSSGRGYFLKWSAWEQTQRGDLEAKTEAKTNGCSRIVNGEDGFSSVVDETDVLVPAVNEMSRSSCTVKRKNRSHGAALNEFFDRAKKLIKEGKLLSDRSRYTISPQSIVRIFVLLEREMTTLREKLGKEQITTSHLGARDIVSSSSEGE